ncbi:MAG: hypothetical protein COC13_03370 [Methanobacteriota archaeon]|jgi:hypothetical protein|nr:MAG: hypothetical protein COC13_03370 [Euryarchaeota archaeon]
MTTERGRTVKALMEEHRRRKAAVKPKTGRPVSEQIPGLNPIAKWYKERGIKLSDVRRGNG